MKGCKKLIAEASRTLYVGTDEETLAERIMDEGLDEEESFEIIDQARRAYEEDEGIAARTELDGEIARVAGALQRREDEDEILDGLTLVQRGATRRER